MYIKRTLTIICSKTVVYESGPRGSPRPHTLSQRSAPPPGSFLSTSRLSPTPCSVLNLTGRQWSVSDDREGLHEKPPKKPDQALDPGPSQSSSNPRFGVIPSRAGRGIQGQAKRARPSWRDLRRNAPWLRMVGIVFFLS